MDALPMVYQISVCVDKYVIHVDGYLSFPKFCCEYPIHYGLEDGWGVGEAKKHNLGLKKPLVGHKCHFPLIPFLDLDVVVSPPYIKLGE